MSASRQSRAFHAGTILRLGPAQSFQPTAITRHDYQAKRLVMSAVFTHRVRREGNAIGRVRPFSLSNSELTDYLLVNGS